MMDALKEAMIRAEDRGDRAPTETHGQIVSDGQFIEVRSGRDGIEIEVRRDDTVVAYLTWDEASELIGDLGRACRWHKRVKEFAP